jgi:hypothetical protein
MFQFGRFPSYTYHQLLDLQYMIHDLLPCGFPHSDIRGLSNVCFYPRLFAAYHVLLRLPVPRHSPCALFLLDLFLFLFRILPANVFKLHLLQFPALLLKLKSFLAVSLFSFQGASSKSFQIPKWWAQVDSNHRPHAYQACALTT